MMGLEPTIFCMAILATVRARAAIAAIAAIVIVSWHEGMEPGTLRIRVTLPEGRSGRHRVRKPVEGEPARALAPADTTVRRVPDDDAAATPARATEPL